MRAQNTGVPCYASHPCVFLPAHGIHALQAFTCQDSSYKTSSSLQMSLSCISGSNLPFLLTAIGVCL